MIKKISDELVAAGAKGTFFFTGTSSNQGCIYSSQVEQRIKYVHSAGHMVASNTWSGKDLTSFASAQIEDSMIRMDEAFSRIIGAKPAFISPPGEKYNNNVRAVLGARKEAIILEEWSAASSEYHVAERAYAKAFNAKEKNLLIANGSPVTDTADKVIPYAIELLQGGYTVCYPLYNLSIFRSRTISS